MNANKLKGHAAVLVIAGAYVVATSRAKVSEDGAHSQSE